MAVIFSLAVATLLTLLVVPVRYSLFQTTTLRGLPGNLSRRPARVPAPATD